MDRDTRVPGPGRGCLDVQCRVVKYGGDGERDGGGGERAAARHAPGHDLGPGHRDSDGRGRLPDDGHPELCRADRGGSGFAVESGADGRGQAAGLAAATGGGWREHPDGDRDTRVPGPGRGCVDVQCRVVRYGAGHGERDGGRGGSAAAREGPGDDHRGGDGRLPDDGYPEL